MFGDAADWQRELERWLAPFLDRLSHPARRAMCPLYIAGLIGPGDRKSIQPMAQRLGMSSHDRLHHFIAAGIWDAAPLEAALVAQANRLVGGPDAYLVIDDTALPKKGSRSVGVAPQYASALGKNANCQTLVSLTLAKGEVPVPVSLRLFLPESWTDDAARLARAGVPEGEPLRHGLGDEQRASRARGRAGGAPQLPDQARDRAHRDRPSVGGRGLLRCRADRCRLRPERAVPPGPERPRARLGGRHPASPEV